MLKSKRYKIFMTEDMTIWLDPYKECVNTQCTERRRKKGEVTPLNKGRIAALSTKLSTRMLTNITAVYTIYTLFILLHRERYGGFLSDVFQHPTCQVVVFSMKQGPIPFILTTVRNQFSLLGGVNAENKFIGKLLQSYYSCFLTLYGSLLRTDWNM